MSMLSTVSPQSLNDFLLALHGGVGDLDAWLECHDEGQVRAHMKAFVDENSKRYEELLLAVGNKYPNESRHETALRYIRQAERPTQVASSAVSMLSPDTAKKMKAISDELASIAKSLNEWNEGRT